MPTLVVRHVPFEDLGTIGAILDSSGVSYDYLDLYSGAAAPDVPDRYGGLILMGGPMSANDQTGYIRRELQLIEEFAALGKPVLGICLGAQLIARAAGARVYRNPVKEIGWAPVYWTEAGRQDCLFAGLGQPENVLHWHGETFDLPAGAEWLAWSEACRHQAFRLGTAYGIQFHLEVTPAMVADWLAQEVNRADAAGFAAPADPTACFRRLRELAEIVFGRWGQSVKAAGSAR